MLDVGKRRGQRAWAIAAVPLLALAVPGCGARAADGEGDGVEPGEPGAEESSELRGAAAGGLATIDTSVLPECGAGFVRSEAARKCGFTFEDVCYETPIDACACACPRGGGSSCIIGGFLNPDVPQRVTCLSL